MIPCVHKTCRNIVFLLEFYVVKTSQSSQELLNGMSDKDKNDIQVPLRNKAKAVAYRYLYFRAVVPEREI